MLRMRVDLRQIGIKFEQYVCDDLALHHLERSGRILFAPFDHPSFPSFWMRSSALVIYRDCRRTAKMQCSLLSSKTF